MALKNRQAGKVEIFVGTEKLVGYAKNVIEFDDIALKTDVATAITKTSLLTALGIPTYANQTAANTFSYHYLINATAGDVLKATAYCSISGSRSAQIEVQ